MDERDQPRFRLATDAPMILVVGVLLLVALATSSRKAFVRTMATAFLSLATVFLLIMLFGR